MESRWFWYGRMVSCIDGARFGHDVVVGVGCIPSRDENRDMFRFCA